MRRRLAVLAVAIVSMLLAGAPTGAITTGQPDGNRHPNVGGLLVHFGDTDQTVLICSGSLIAPDLFLTAGHCNPDLFPPEWETTLVGVTFEPAFRLDDGTIVPAREFVAHPDYSDADWPYTPDIAVVRLSEPATNAYPGIEPVDVPAIGALDAIVAEPGWRKQQVTQVGYGTTGVTHGGGPPQQIYPDIRTFAVAWLRQGPRPWGMESSYLFNTSHPGGPGGGGGGTCNGDSGGPIFLGGARSNLQLGVVSGGPGVGPDGVLCRTAKSFAFRLDTVLAQTFLCRFGVVDCPGAAKAGKALRAAGADHSQNRAAERRDRRRD